LFTGVGTTGRVPDAEERYLNLASMGGSMNGVNVGDPNLPLVRNNEGTVGMIVHRGSSYVKTTFFYSSIGNYILVNQQPQVNMSMMDPATIRSYTNVDARIYGGEISYAFSLPAGFSFAGGGSYTRRRFVYQRRKRQQTAGGCAIDESAGDARVELCFAIGS
jgi:iron complex outermembrane receptor protein